MVSLREEWETYGPKDTKSPIQEMHENFRQDAKTSLIKAIIFGIGCIILGVKALFEFRNNAYLSGAVESSETIYDSRFIAKEEGR